MKAETVIGLIMFAIQATGFGVLWFWFGLTVALILSGMVLFVIAALTSSDSGIAPW